MRTFDARRRLTSETNGENDRARLRPQWDRTDKSLPEGNVWAYAFDRANRLTGVTDPLSSETSYTYDGNDNRTTQRDATARRRPLPSTPSTA